MSTVDKKFLKIRGIQHTIGPTDTFQYFSVVERANRTIGERAESMRKFAQMPNSAWGYARKKMQRIFGSDARPNPISII